MLALIDADDAGLDLARALVESAAGKMICGSTLRAVASRAPAAAASDARRDVFRPSIRQSGRELRAIHARRANGEEAFKAVMQSRPRTCPPVYRELPIYYITNRFTVVGPETTVRWPRYSQVMDYELEFAIVTRRTRANISLSEAAAHIFGYTIFNDFSARDRQTLEMEGRLGPAKGKSFDGANVLGPWIVTPDELGDPQTLKVEVRVNGETRSTGDKREMLFPFDALLADASQDETIYAGEVFGRHRRQLLWPRDWGSLKAATRSISRSSASAC